MNDLAALLGGPVVAAARGLLGRLLVSEIGAVRTAVILTEVEAYGGGDDPASHAHGGPTPRNQAMFGPPGTLYVYRSYGVHWCANVVCGPAGIASAVLLRGGLVAEGAAAIRRRRGRTDHLCDGPGKLTQALGITGALDGSSLLAGLVRVEGAPIPGRVRSTPRVGITRAAGRRWRFFLGVASVDNPVT
ncbi:MAG TPA: DNA-3-methyladenine glycosylase [Acidimicrobiia bacterium]